MTLVFVCFLGNRKLGLEHFKFGWQNKRPRKWILLALSSVSASGYISVFITRNRSFYPAKYNSTNMLQQQQQAAVVDTFTPCCLIVYDSK